MVLDYFFNNQQNNNKNNSLKIYTIVDFPSTNKTYGTYEAKSAKSAGHLAFNDLLKFINIKENQLDGKFLVFVLKNTANGKTYKYTGTRVALKNPVLSNGKEFKFKNVIARYTPEFDKI